MFIIARIILTALRWYSYALFIYVILEYIQPHHKITNILRGICEPVLIKVRKVLYNAFPSLYKLPLDISPLAVYFLIQILSRIVWMLFRL